MNKMNNNDQTENFLRKIKSMEDADLMLAYKNRSDYTPEFAELLVEEMSIRGSDVTEVDTMSLEDIDVVAIKNKSTDELVEIYYKRGSYKTGWDIFAKNELKNRGIDVEQLTVEKQPMFKGCFSFRGRIRRLEYGLSFIIFSIVIELCFSFSGGIGYDIMSGIFSILALWFDISQSTRRCHDLGHCGWWQLIPFYNLAMLFSAGDLGKNKYGDNPKGEGNISY